MTKKLFIKLSMLLFVLGMSTNVAWADDDPMRDFYWARLIAQPSTGTGGAGKVCVTSDGKPFNYDSPAWKSDTSRAEGYSEVYIEISAGNMFNVDLTAHALPDEGSYFTGWSFSNGGTDLGIGTYGWEKYELRQFFLPSKKYGYSNLREYEIYATFMPLLIESYTISGSNTTESRTCTQTVTFRVVGTLANVKDFNVPEIIKQSGSGTWTVVPNTTEAWEYENGAGTKNYTYSTTYDDYAEIRVPVTFTADDDNAGEFSATLQLRSKAGKTMNVVLSARTLVGGGAGNAVLYDGKTEQASGTVTAMLAVNTSSYTNPILKLSGDYNQELSVGKNLTVDLNGFTLSNTLKVTAGDVKLAYSAFGGTIEATTAVDVTGGKLTLNGGAINGAMTNAGILELNGAAITGNVTNSGTMTTTDGSITGQLESSGTLTLKGGTFTNNSGVAVNITGGTAQIKKGTINGSTYGVQSAGSTAIEKLAAITGTTRALKRTAGTLTVNNGKFSDPADLAEGDIVFNAAYFQNTTGTTAFGKQVWRNTAGAEYRDGYLFFVGDQDAAQASNVSVCRIGKTAYASLEEAFAYANNNPSKEVVIFMENDYTLKAGYYTIPENATLVIPMSDEQDATYSIVPRESGDTPSPYAFRTLTLENGVNMTVLGTIELTCTQYCKSGNEAQSIPGGPYGHMILKPGSHITLSSGSELRAWGYVTGDGTRDASGNYLSGEIDARRGSVVREQFQMGDWKGGDISFTMIMDQAPQNMTRLFPVYEYFIQNIESPVKYHPGASLICAVSVDVSYINAYANEIRLIGVETSDPAKWSMFMMDETADAENTWVRKYYDAKKDQQVYEVNNSAQLGSLKIDLGEVSGEFFGLPGKYHIELDSRKFVLPLTSNFKIHLLSGLMEFTQSTSCLPGMEVEVDKEAEIQIIPSSDPGTVSGALYFYDADQWSFMNMKLGSYVGLASNMKYGAIVTYSATLNCQPTVRNVDTPDAIGDAKLIVHGTFRSASGCSVYTTWTKDSGNSLEHNPFVINPNGTGGASIISTNEDAGTFIFDDASPNFDGVHWDDPANFGQIEHLTSFGNSVLVNFDNNNYGDATYPIQIYTVLEKELYKSNKYTRMYGFELCTPAKLQNGDGTLVETEGSPAGTSYCYRDGHWTTMQVAEDECFMKEKIGGDSTYYAKPQEYVAVAATWDGVKMVGNSDHTFSDKAGAGRLFILMEDCQWWEVEKKDNLYHCIHPNNDTYYYWNGSKWVEKRFTITWKNYDGTEIKSYTYDPVTGDPEEVEYSVTYGTQAEYLGSNPTRPADIDYTYNFTGWAPALGKVTSDVTYTATYEKQQRKYTIIFTEEGGAEIERQFLIHNAMPECENTPTRTGFTLQWEPEVAAVTGDATYRATWLEEPPTEYAVTFYDYDGTTKLKPTGETPYMVEVGAVPVAPANPSGKAPTNEFTYEFDHWSPELEAVSATSAKSYTAVYREVEKKYTVIFQNEDGSEIERHDYSYGETPVCSATPTKANTAQYTYSFAWTPQIQTVQGAATYQAVFTPTTNKYTVTLQCNLPGKCTFTGAGIYDYGTSATITATPADGYEFVKWQERTGGANLGSVEVNGDITLTAIVKESAKPDPANLTVGIDDTKTVASATDYMNLTITSDGLAHSSQIVNANNISLYGNADFLLSKEFAKRTWYCIAVPWRVEANGGIIVNGKTAVLGTDIEICYYDGAVRAAQGKVPACWVYMKNLSTKKILEPGRAYMIALLKTSASSITFRKKVQEPILTTGTSVQEYPSATATDAGWNAIANPSLFHTYVNAGSTDAKAQRYNSADDSYGWFNLDEHKLVVGEPIYVQAPADKSIVVANGASYAPARRANAQAVPTKYEVSVTAAGATKYADHLSIKLNEDKESDQYIIGQDLVKFGVSTKVAQMWIDRYDAKLCVNAVAPEEDATSFPMSLFAPKAGDYTIAIDREVAAEDYNLYLTYNGQAIWNLSDGAYAANLNKGTDANYGLRISLKAPQVTTGVDEAIVDAKGETRKVLINNQVFIIRGDKVYSVDGRLVK